MNIDQIKEKLKSSDYKFLIDNPDVNFDKLLLLTVAGSHAYGTNTETSDLDVRGITVTPQKCIFGLSNFEQFEDSKTDTVIYEFKRMINLLSNCNPNCIEILGNRPEMYMHLSEQGKLLIKNRHLFLSQKAIHTFGGYANAQLRRLQNAVARDSLTQPDKELHIKNSITHAMEDIKSKYADMPDNSINLYVDKAVNPEYETEMFIDVNLTHYPLRDYKNIWSDMNNIVKSYSHLNTRNSKKDDIHLNKHIMHLFRLYLMAIDILKDEEIITYRENDIDFLMAIRNGYFMNSDGTVKSELYNLLDEYEKKFKLAAENTHLPKIPDYEQIEKLTVDILEDYYL